MADLLPSTPDLSTADESDPRIIGVDSEDADELLSALSSGTARSMLAALHDEPDTASGLADRLDTSLQNAQYHLGNLRDADLVNVADTIYSEKGREMKVYAPADQPLVVYAGKEEQTLGLRQALSRLIGGVAVVGLASLLVQVWLRGVPSLGLGMQAGSGGAEGDVQLASTEAKATALDQAAGLPPGLLFFVGGVTVLLAGFVVWYWRSER